MESSLQKLLKFFLTLLVISCSHTATETPPPPIAGLWHPAAVRLGQPVTLNAGTTAIGQAPVTDPGEPGTRVTHFRFEIATFPAVDQALPTLDWTFAQAGHFALRVVVTDDLGRTSSADSAIDVVANLAEACTGATAEACASGVCAAGQCAAFACAGAPACPPGVAGRALTCDRGMCAVNPAAASPEDAFGGDDVAPVGPADGG